MAWNAKLGLALFFVYAAVYLAFVLLNAFFPEAMERTPVAGINLAILSGLGLILFAFLLSALYGVCCTHEDENTSSHRSGGV